MIYWKSQSYATHAIIYKHSLMRCPWGILVSLHKPWDQMRYWTVINTPSWFLKIKSTMMSWLGKYSSLWEQTFMLHYFVTVTAFFERVFYFHWYRCPMCLYAAIIVSNIFKWYISFYSNYPPHDISTLIFSFLCAFDEYMYKMFSLSIITQRMLQTLITSNDWARALSVYAMDRFWSQKNVL